MIYVITCIICVYCYLKLFMYVWTYLLFKHLWKSKKKKKFKVKTNIYEKNQLL